MKRWKKARANPSHGEGTEPNFFEEFEDPLDVGKSAEIDMSQMTPLDYHKDRHGARYEATKKHWEANPPDETDFAEQSQRAWEADIEKSKDVKYTAKVDETRERGIHDDEIHSQTLEELEGTPAGTAGCGERTDTGERAELEGELFIRIMSAIDATRPAYEDERASMHKRDDLKTEFAKCLSALSSLKLAWPLPRHPFDAEALRLIEDVFKDLDATRLALNNSANSLVTPRVPDQVVSGQILTSSIECAQRCRLSFEAIVDMALAYIKLSQVTSEPYMEDRARQQRQDLIAAGLAANGERIAMLANPPPQLYLESGPQESLLTGLLNTDHYTQLIPSPSQRLLKLLQSRLENDSHLLSITGAWDQANPRRERNGAHHHEEISRLVEARWKPKWLQDTCVLNVVFDWEIEAFMTNCLSGDGDLGAVLTVTGDSGSAYSAACCDYVSWQWGAIGLRALDMASSIPQIFGLHDGMSEEIDGVVMTLERSGSSNFTVSLSARDMDGPLSGYWLLIATSVIQVMAWMASVFRVPRQGLPHCSSLQLPLQLTLDPSEDFNISLGLSTPATHNCSSCWHDLLPNTTVATGFPIRHHEFGLDVEWELMLDLADIIFHIDLSKLDMPPPLDSGIFCSGVNSLLYPVSKSGNVIKWHFDPSGKSAVPPPDNFLRIKSVQTITESMHVVGFAAQSEVRLGTRRRTHDYARMCSVVGSIERGRPEIAIDAFSATIGKAPASATASMKVKFPSTLRATVEPQRRRYDEIVKKTKDQAVILYDCGHQRGAWLVPQLSVILDLVYYRMFKEQWGEPPKHAKACADGGAAAAETLKDPLVYLHKLSPILEDNSDFKIMDLVKEIYEAMLKRRILHEATASGSLMLHRERLHGWDLLEIADAPDQSFRREIEVHQTTSRAIAQYPSWLPLTQHIPVYLGQDLGHVISVGNQPLPMRHVKNREKCLVANVHTLQNLLRNRDECSDFHLDCELVWELPSSVASMFLEMTGVNKDPASSKRIEHCLQRLQGSKDHVCTLRNERTTLCANGLVIFGPENTKLSKFNDFVDSLGIGAMQVNE